MKRKSKNPRSGSSFDDFLKEEKIYARTTAVAIKRVLVMQLEREMKKRHITKVAMAKRMNTSRTQVDRILSPTNTGCSLTAIQAAASAVGQKVQIRLGGI